MNWIQARFTKRRAKRADARRSEEVLLFLCRLEDRRVLNGTGGGGAGTVVNAVPDAYFVSDPSSSLYVPGQLGLVSNDSQTGTGPPLEVEEEFIATDKGGTVDVYADGSFDYTPPANPGQPFVDHFLYTATNGTDSSNPTDVTLFAGGVPVPFDQPTSLPIFGVEYEVPTDIADVSLYSPQGASLTLLDTTGITFTYGNNGENDISFEGTAQDVNHALQSLQYDSLGFSGQADLYFDAFVGGPPPPPGQNPPPGQGPPPEEYYEYVPIFVAPPDGVPQNLSGVIAEDDQYFADPLASGVYFSPEAGVLSNDFSTLPEDYIYAESGSFQTALGGWVELSSDGSFFYTPPSELNGNTTDFFVYYASDEISTSNPGFVTLYLGEVPTYEDQSILLPLFTADNTSPQDFVDVQLSSAKGGALILLDPQGITFDSTTPNGSSTLYFSGEAQDVNLALDLLAYVPPVNFSGTDYVTFQYAISGGRGQGENEPQIVPIDVAPVADAPQLYLSPNPVNYLPGLPAPVNIDVVLTDTDGSEIPGLVILQGVPQGVVPSVGQQSALDPGTYFILPQDVPNLSFVIDAAAPPTFQIAVIASSIEKTDQPGVFGGPGGPLLPDDPSDLRFALTGQPLKFVRLPMPDGPPPSMMPPPHFMQTQAVFILGPLSGPPPEPPQLAKAPEHQAPPAGPHGGVGIIQTNTSPTGNQSSGSPVAAANGARAVGDDAANRQEQTEEQGRRSSESTGIYVRKLGSDGPGQTARLPEELSEDYAKFMTFLKTLPNGDYVVYFKRGGQSHEQAVVRQAVVKVRVVNHRLNPDPGEFKPAGEVAEPPQDPNAKNLPISNKIPDDKERAELILETEIPPAMPADDWTPIAAGAWFAAIGAWKLRASQETYSAEVDQMMERFLKSPSPRFRRRTMKQCP